MNGSNISVSITALFSGIFIVILFSAAIALVFNLGMVLVAIISIMMTVPAEKPEKMD